jgi:arylsulfatase A-like enzyme
LGRASTVLAAAAVTLALLSTRTRPAGPPDVVLVSIDTLSWSSLRALAPGAPGLPQLDRLARRSVVFSNAVTAASWTLPAQASLLTGLYPDRHGATDARRMLWSTLPTLAEALRAAGYHTVALTDAGFVHRRFGFGRGFQRYDEWAEPGAPEVGLPRDGKPNRKSRKALLDRAFAFLATVRPADPPVFLFLHTYAVHDYYLTQVGGHTDYRSCLQGRITCTPQEWQRLSRRYAEEAAHLDQAFGRLLATLARTRRPTLLVVVSDHGEGLDPAAGRIHHGGRLHADVLRIPLLVAGLGLEPRVVTDPVSIVDVAPTLIELLGRTAPPGLDGRSLVSALHGRPLAPRPLLAMEHYYSWGPRGRVTEREVREQARGLAVIDGDRWYIAEPEGEQLYDMRVDPDQKRSLSPGDFLAPLRALVATRGRLSATGVAGRIEDMDPALREQLQSLGYIE